MDEQRGPGRPPVAGKAQDARIQLRTLGDEKAQYERAAGAADMTLSDWMRDRLNRAAKRELRKAH